MAVALGTNIANPISTALSNRSAFDIMGKLENYGKLGVSNPDAVIEALFASGEQGAWYDPSDLTTMFQDSAGTTPVTADGQPVGLILDKSKGLVLGPELVTNGSFDVGTGWSLTNSTISGGKLVCNAGGSVYLAMQSVAFSYPKSYEVNVVVSGLVSGNCTVVFGVGTNIHSPAMVSNGAYKFIIASGSGNSELRILSSGSGFIGDIESISVKELTGNHASQATAASRPLYKTDGTYHWLQFDGVDDYIGCSWSSITALSTLFAGVNRTNSSNWVMFMPSASSPQPFLGVCQAGDSSAPEASSGTPSYTVNNTLVSPSQRSVLNSAIGVGSKKVVTIENIDLDNAVFPWSGFGFGLYAGFYPTFNMYSTIAVGKQCTPTEITDTETWVNSKTGAF